MTAKKMPGSHCTDDVRTYINGLLATYSKFWLRQPRLVDAGMEDMRSAYLLLDIDGARYLLLERRNDDGEWAPLLYDTDLAETAGVEEVFSEMANIGEYADELRGELEDLGLVANAQDDWVEEFFRDALYGVRDIISPDALR